MKISSPMSARAATGIFPVLLFFWSALFGLAIEARAGDEIPFELKILGGQANFIGQSLDPFNSPYSGKNSLTPNGDKQATQAYGIYLGARLADNLQLYLDLEDLRGSGISKTSGVSAITNGDALRIGSVDLGSDPYLARGYVRYSVPLSEKTEKKESGQGQLAGEEAVERIDVKLGRFSIADDFDQNRYANNTRAQFMDWAFINNLAWDYAADTRGYSNGVVVAWINPSFDLRFGAVQVPTFANGNIFDNDVSKAFGLNTELAVKRPSGLVARFLAFYNKARMGKYSEALAAGTPPYISADDQPGRVKYGFGINLEQPLADDGETGLFARLGWNDGNTESFAYSEADTHLSLGAQISGTHWRREEDRIGIGVAYDGLSTEHQNYLASGGNGFLLGDGKLNYSGEKVLEAYYRVQLGKFVQVSPDYIFIADPGNNADRGPANIYSVRLRVYF